MIPAERGIGHRGTVKATFPAPSLRSPAKGPDRTDSRRRRTPLHQVQILAEGAKLQLEAVVDVDDHCLSRLDGRLVPHREKDLPMLAQGRARVGGFDRGENPE